MTGGHVFFFQAEDGIRDLVRSRGLGDVYKRQGLGDAVGACRLGRLSLLRSHLSAFCFSDGRIGSPCLLYTSDAADERSSVDLGGRRIIKKKICVICGMERDRVPTQHA